jgi:D-methionine transport system substrate-binding protein
MEPYMAKFIKDHFGAETLLSMGWNLSEAGFNPPRDSLIIEGAESLYVNGLVVRKGDENDPRLAALKKVLQSKKVKDYIDSHYSGGVVAPSKDGSARYR